jgi:RimJ/RimL family protein N-acetyltransferase
MIEMPVLETKRLIIRPFESTDLQAAHLLFDVELDATELGSEKMTSLHEREEWLQWSVLHHRQLALLNQPPYGDRAIVLRSTSQIIGSCGFVPALNAFEQFPYFSKDGQITTKQKYTAEVALFYAISPSHQRQGYALESVRELIRFGFENLHLKRIIAETDYTNTSSIAVMHKIGMTIQTNPFEDPPRLQVVGILENPE